MSTGVSAERTKRSAHYGLCSPRLTHNGHGQHLHSMASGLAAISRAIAEQYSFEATKAGKLGSYKRREVEWTFQSNSAKSEINQIFKQLRGAQIREAIAKKEYDNHQVQMQNAQQIVDFLQGNDVGGGLPIKRPRSLFTRS